MKIASSLLVATMLLCLRVPLRAQNQTPPPFPNPTGGVRSAPPPVVGTPAAQTPPPADSQTPGKVTPKTPSYPQHTPQRFNDAIGVITDSTSPKYPQSPTIQEDCAPPAKSIYVQAGWEDGGQSVSYLNRSGHYCFEIQQANTILYTYSPSLKTQTPNGNPFDLMNDAISTIKGFGTGTTTNPVTKVPTPESCQVSVDDVAGKAAALQQVMTTMQPGKDNNGKILSIRVEDTVDAWKAVPQAFSDLQDGVSRLISQMGRDPNLANCADVFAQAESIILDNYVTARDQFVKLKARVNSHNVVYYGSGVDSTNGYDLIVTEYYGGQQTSASSKTYHFDPAYSPLTSSAGFLLTELPARSYTSVTAPNPSNPSASENVLAVNGRSGPRPALVVLLNANPPLLNWRHLGLGVSGGAVFDVSNGKADTSRFGFFGGISLRLTPWLYLTPGVHVGQFADFPQGFGAPGQLIPPNTGTPVATNRYTARFAFAFTFKLKDIGAASSTTQTSSNQTTGTTTQNKPKSPSNSAQ